MKALSHYFRDPFSGLSHLVSAIVAAVAGIVMLVIAWGDPGKWISLLVYSISLVLLLSASATYHLVKGGPRLVAWLRKLDHTSIYLLIAGTYTPICFQFFQGSWRLGMLIAIWSFAVVGIIVKLFIIKAPRWITAGIYLLMGWLAVIGIGEILRNMPPAAFIWVLVGGLFFTVGAIIYILKKPDFFPGVFGFHEVWHIFVILGCLAHFITIAVYVAPV